MSSKYHITTRKLEPRFPTIPKYSSLEAEGCLGCLECVKRVSCIYDVYRNRRFDPHYRVDTGDMLCLNCMRCIQECKKGILSRTINPLYERMGDNDYWKPDIISKIWNQAETGKIPVSGAGFRGQFSGPGFDGIWTDMSEIVRPTRDGIHGREYISTVIELGRRPLSLKFDKAGKLLTKMPPFKELPLPMILDIPTIGIMGQSTRTAMLKAASCLGTLAVAGVEESNSFLADYARHMILKFNPDTDHTSLLKGIPIVEVPYSEKVLEKTKSIKSVYPSIIVSIRLPLDEYALKRALQLSSQGAEIIHLQADNKGRGLGKRTGDFITILMRDIHQGLVEKGVREQVTLLVSGGIALAEHVAKIIICGADGVGVDLALLIALECRLYSDCGSGGECPIQMDSVPVEWGTQRLVNLFASWHSQLIEVLGAMGIREIRRLRGEAGRAMFFEDLESECFSSLFKKKNQFPKTVGKHQSQGKGGKQVLSLSQGKGQKDVSSSSQGKEGKKVSSLSQGKGQKQVSSSFQCKGQKDVSSSSQVKEGRGEGRYSNKNNLINKDLVSYCAHRFRNQLSKYKVVRISACIACGKCLDVCSYGVHRKGGQRMLAPLSHLCQGPEKCRAQGTYCVDQCPQKAIRVGPNPLWETFGDPRWTADLIVSTWNQAETGKPPEQATEYREGTSGGGFDKLDFVFPKNLPDVHFKSEDVDLRLPLNRRDDGRPKITIGFPLYGGGMSFGAINLTTMLSRARAYKAFNSFTCTGEGGYPDELAEYKDYIITQVATGLFGVQEETIQRARIVEFKYAQGAKPGLGGHLLGDKVTPTVAKMREAVKGSSLFSPFPFHSVYSVEDHKKHVDWIQIINPRALVSVKVSTPVDVDMVAVGSYYAGAHIIHLDGSYGGTGAAPDIAKKNIAMPIEYAIPKVHKFLVEEGIRDKITFIASGGLRTVWDVAKAIALGADGVVICTAEMTALGCIRCGNCESGRGCPRGIATTDPELETMYDSDWATQRLINLFYSWYVQLQEILWRLGLKSIRELVGRSDLLTHRDYSA